MRRKLGVSSQTRNNFWIDAALLTSAWIASITGMYFLFFPVGGYQGGRNPYYGITFLFGRETWDDLHTWFGIIMIVAAAIHITIHWEWIVKMTKRVLDDLVSSQSRFNPRSRFNVWLNIVVGFSFLLAAISGIFLLFFPGGRNGVADPGFLFNRTTWDLIHTWAGIVMVGAAVIHFAIHWHWVRKVASKMLRSINSPEMGNLVVNQVNSKRN